MSLRKRTKTKDESDVGEASGTQTPTKDEWKQKAAFFEKEAKGLQKNSVSRVYG